MAKIRVADYIIQFLENKNIEHAFTVTGGGAMYLNDGLAKSKHIHTVFNHHEQACAMAGVGYSKVHNKPCLVMATTGCGSTNTITGLLDAWQDSNKVFFISGNVNKKETTHNSKVPLRKLGTQEANIVDIIKSITKYVVMINNENDIAYHLEKAWFEMESGRPGPVWIDVPLDIQSSFINEEDLHHFQLPSPILETNNNDLFFELLQKSKRPIIVAGNGIHLANAREKFKNFIEKYNIPYVATFLGIDFLPQDHPLYIGRIGLKGTRAGNFALANSDLIISLGSSLSIPAIGFRYELFGREAKKLIIDIDEYEHKKETINVDCFIKQDINVFLNNIISSTENYINNQKWNDKCVHWKNKWSSFDRPDINTLNMYSFSKMLSEISKNNIVSSDAGSAYYVLAQSLLNNKLVIPAAQGEMGFALPSSIGCYLADSSKTSICVTGEGSFQFNIQELQTIKQNKLPIKIFVLNNGGYLSIKTTQTKFFEKRLFGTNEESGISFPDLSKISEAYGFPFMRINTIKELQHYLPIILQHDGFYLCEVMCPHDEVIYPTSATIKKEDGSVFSQPLENMAPFLSEEEFKQEMIINIHKQ